MASVPMSEPRLMQLERTCATVYGVIRLLPHKNFPQELLEKGKHGEWFRIPLSLSSYFKRNLVLEEASEGTGKNDRRADEKSKELRILLSTSRRGTDILKQACGGHC